MPQSDVLAVPAEIGGGFGGKTIVYLEPLALVLSRKSGRPVKMTMSREEVFRASGPTSGSSSTVKIGVTKDGRITAATGTFKLQAGALPGSPIRGAAAAPTHPTTSRTSTSSATMSSATGRRSPPTVRRARRSAPTRSSACSTRRREAIGMDPLELRLKNAAKQGTKAAYGPVYLAWATLETVERRDGASALQGAARPQPGPRRGLRLLVQCRR